MGTMETNLRDLVARLYARKRNRVTGALENNGNGTAFRIATPHLPPEIELYGSVGHVGLAQAANNYQLRTNIMELLVDNRGRSALSVPLYASMSLFQRPFEIELEDGTYYDMPPLTSSPDVQLSVLHRRLHSGFSLPALNLAGPSVPLEPGEDVTLVGCTNGQPSIGEGTVKETFNRKPYFNISMLDQTINSGASGGVILNKDMDVLGLISRATTGRLESECLLYTRQQVLEIHGTYSRNLATLVDAASAHILADDGWLEEVVSAYEDR